MFNIMAHHTGNEVKKMTTIKWKFSTRRKAEEFVIYKPDEDGNVVIQSNKTIAQVNHPHLNHRFRKGLEP